MKKFIKKVGTAFMASALVASSAVSAFAASSQESNNTATTNDLANADIIDTSKKGSIKIHKYDIASAKADGVYEAGTKKTTGEQDTELETTMADYAIEGVEFTYLRCGEVETLREILGLQTDDAIDMNAKNVANPCQKAGVYHYTSQQLDDAIKKILEDDNIAGKDALEDYVTSNPDAVKMPLTNDKGFTNADQLDLGLYLFVETKVPTDKSQIRLMSTIRLLTIRIQKIRMGLMDQMSSLPKFHRPLTNRIQKMTLPKEQQKMLFHRVFHLLKSQVSKVKWILKRKMRLKIPMMQMQMRMQILIRSANHPLPQLLLAHRVRRIM